MQVQGYLFGKPGPRSGIEHIVNGEAATPVVAKVA